MTDVKSKQAKNKLFLIVFQYNIVKQKYKIFYSLLKKALYFCLFRLFIVPLHHVTGCSSVRLEYTSGGREVAGSNPVTPTHKRRHWYSMSSLVLYALPTAGYPKFNTGKEGNIHFYAVCHTLFVFINTVPARFYVTL